ncbi:protein kinase domain-containing protein [Luteimonas sp. e5]
MESTRWQRVRDLFEKACELPPEQWDHVLDACGDDPEIVAEVRQLLRAQTVKLDRVGEILKAHGGAELGEGDRLGPWRLCERIGAGGMGVVFRAERADGSYQQQVAIKLLSGFASRVEIEHLIVERQMLADLQLPNVARLYDGGLTPAGQPYLVMELVDGVALDRWYQGQALDLEARLTLFLAICTTVQAAHERLVLHRDLKPENILVRADGRPVLLDFGLAQVTTDAMSRQTRYCTPAYASPERLSGQDEGVSTDIFSLGVLFVEMLADTRCDRELDDASRPVALPSQLAAASVPWKRQLQGDLDAIAGRATALRAADRYHSVEAFIADIRLHQRHFPVTAHPGGLPYRTRKAVRRNWKVLASLFSVAILTALMFANVQQARQRAEQDAAIAEQVSNFLIDTFEVADPLKRGEHGVSELSARQLLDRAAQRVTTDLQDAPVQRARMQLVLGEAYQNLGIPGAAEAQLRGALPVFRQLSGTHSREWARLMAVLSVQETLNGDGRAGRDLADQALARLPRKNTEPERARLYAARGFALSNLQAFDESVAAYHKALDLYADLPAASVGLDALRARYQLGHAFALWGRQQDAEREFRSVLAQLGGRSPVLHLATETRLGQVLRWQGQLSEALPLLQQALAEAQAIYGPDSGMLILQHDALADLYLDMGDYPASEAQYRQRLALSEKVQGPDSIGHSMGLFNFGALLEAREDLAGAEALYRQAWAIRMQQLGEDATTTLRAQTGLGEVLLKMGRLQQAGEMLSAADAGLTRQLPDDAPGRLESRLVFARWQLAMGQVAQAGATLAEVDPHVGEGEFDIIRWHLHGLLAAAKGQHAAAVSAMQRALMLSTAHYGNDSPDTARMRLALAQVLIDAGSRAEAGAQLRLAGPILRTHLVATAPSLRQLRDLEQANAAQDVLTRQGAR